MSGNPELRREFLATLESGVAKLVVRVFDRMQLAGEAGSLLRIDEDIREAIREIHLAAPGELLRPLDEDRWERAEEKVLRALKAYADHPTNGGAFQRRLFADDAVRGLGFVDVCSQRYDVVLMNPPFGDGTAPVLDLLARLWPNAKRNLYIYGFVYRAFELLSFTKDSDGCDYRCGHFWPGRSPDSLRGLLRRDLGFTDAEGAAYRAAREHVDDAPSLRMGGAFSTRTLKQPALSLGGPPRQRTTRDDRRRVRRRESEDRQDLIQTSTPREGSLKPLNVRGQPASNATRSSFCEIARSSALSLSTVLAFWFRSTRGGSAPSLRWVSISIAINQGLSRPRPRRCTHFGCQAE